MKEKNCFILRKWQYQLLHPKLVRIVLVTLFLTVLSMPRVARAGGSFYVNSSADSNSYDNYLTLREAILVDIGSITGPFSPGEQTQLGGCTFDSSGFITGFCGGGYSDDINFESSVTQINLTDPLPALTDQGTYLNGINVNPRIDASGIQHPGDVFTVSNDNVTITNITVVNGDLQYSDIRIVGGKNIWIIHNYLGTIPDATSCLASGVTRNSAYGISVSPNSSGSSDTGVAYIHGNIIGCHASHGIYIAGADYVYIGVQADGTEDPNAIGGSTIADLGNGGDGVRLEANGMDGVRFNVVEANAIIYNDGNGITLVGTGSNSSGSTTNNWIKKNVIFNNNKSGIRLTAGAYINFIGMADNGNIIGRNAKQGVEISSSNNNLIQGNFIGTLANINYGNSEVGVYLENADSNTVTGNTISNNGWAGVWVNSSDNNTIKNNKIGTNEDGTNEQPNNHDGIALTDGSHDNWVGGTTLADRNIISGNKLCGIRLRDGAYSNIIDFNIIGLGTTGNKLANGEAGVCVYSSSNSNSIGSSRLDVYQYISGNKYEGIYIENSDGNSIGETNRIGVATDNVTAQGNGTEGVMLNGATNTTVAPTLVAYNYGAGITVIGSTATGNFLRPAEVRNNGGLPIDLGNDGHTENGSQVPPGPNNWLNYPVITGSIGNTINGTACANCSVWVYRAFGNPAYPAGGGILLAITMANSSGNWSYTLPSGVGRNDVTLLATQSGSVLNTSEFSPRRPLLYLPLIIK